jgi:hypothetical protein
MTTYVRVNDARQVYDAVVKVAKANNIFVVLGGMEVPYDVMCEVEQCIHATEDAGKMSYACADRALWLLNYHVKAV